MNFVGVCFYSWWYNCFIMTMVVRYTVCDVKLSFPGLFFFPSLFLLPGLFTFTVLFPYTFKTSVQKSADFFEINNDKKQKLPDLKIYSR